MPPSSSPSSLSPSTAPQNPRSQRLCLLFGSYLLLQLLPHTSTPFPEFCAHNRLGRSCLFVNITYNRTDGLFIPRFRLYQDVTEKSFPCNIVSLKSFGIGRESGISVVCPRYEGVRYKRTSREVLDRDK